MQAVDAGGIVDIGKSYSRLPEQMFVETIPPLVGAGDIIWQRTEKLQIQCAM